MSESDHSERGPAEIQLLPGGDEDYQDYIEALLEAEDIKAAEDAEYDSYYDSHVH